jgi:predicted enzyme related to lactoylglutathione lyase
MPRFFHYTLRTSDVEAAHRFYGSLLGEGPLNIVMLHEQAVARGARPHWLGFIEVDDVNRAANAFVERGATQLAPKWVNPEGLEASVLHDPGGAVVAVAKAPPSFHAARYGPDVAWHSLMTADVERAKANYGELFGWEFKPSVDLGDAGVNHPFSWERGGPPIGSMGAVEGRPGVHPHWLFHLRVSALDPAMAAVREGGGVIVAVVTLPGGERVAVCDDPQGAAFAIHASGA